ncbi:hypothetical protein GCM10023185_35090 [Hymenobacter saemangeumensis]|uniref:DUF4476 domain-containing protein n=1 Tax=Hymenobacter saemangeumensis TaxID=1084522 RepID=A0ABP8IPZ8_9BACT
MKTFVIACLAVASSLVARPVAAHSEPEHATAGISAAIASAPRPLVHFLINSLDLQEHEVLAVTKALKARPMKYYTPEELVALLRPVLTAEQLTRLQTLRPTNELRDELRYLATLH